MKKKESEKIKNKRQEELETVSFMIEIFCRGKQGSDKGDLCEECKELMEYVKKRVQNCPMMEEKTFCSACKIHCYRGKERENIREVMRYSGPRMLFHHPIAALRHLFGC